MSNFTSNDDGFSYFEMLSQSKYYPHEGNSSITTSVTIRVTPLHYHLVSWAFLWGGFWVGIALACWQIRMEHQWFASRRRNDLEQQHSAASDLESVSNADLTRSLFRKLLLVAMVTRMVMIPVQMWSEPLWAQFVADTLPEMTFASAWTLLVNFFVQVVGMALGTGTLDTNSSGWVLQAIAYVAYFVVIGTSFWNPVASVLLYALLCCIYAALFGTTLYFCPKLLLLLKPSLRRHSALSIRLAACTILCLTVFWARTFGFARKVVARPHAVYWWWQYGALELIPAIVFLLMMHPKSVNAQGSQAPVNSGSNVKDVHSVAQHQREDSHGSGSRRTGESAPLVKLSVSGYGSNSSVH